MEIKKKITATAIICLLALLTVSIFTGFWKKQEDRVQLKVGFICSEDESTPYTYNFLQGQYALTEQFGNRVQVFVRSNVHENVIEESKEKITDVDITQESESEFESTTS